MIDAKYFDRSYVIFYNKGAKAKLNHQPKSDNPCGTGFLMQRYAWFAGYDEAIIPRVSAR